MLDIDDFKEVNDKFGHAFGDLALQNFGNLQQASVRSSDKVVRWGGEEFLIYLSNIDEVEVCRIAENVRAMVENTSVADEQHSANITVSIGIAYSHEADELKAVIKLADKRLYTAKRKDKNCVVDWGFVKPTT